MRLPRFVSPDGHPNPSSSGAWGPTPTPGRRRAAVVGAAIVAAFALAGPASAHPGPVDSSGGHYCTEAQAASNLCTPGGTYHRHNADGDAVLYDPGPEAAQLTGQQAGTGQPFTPGGTPTPTTAPGTPPTAAPPANPDLAVTGPISMEVAVFGGVLAGLGLAALAAHRRIPLPVILEFERRATA